MEEWRAQLTVTPDFIAANETFAGVRDGRFIGFHALCEEPGAFRLEHLWILPDQIGQGFGRGLFRHAAARAAERGASYLTIEADPHAEPFYRRMGAVLIGAVRSEIEGQARALPLLRFDLTPQSSSLA